LDTVVQDLTKNLTDKMLSHDDEHSEQMAPGSPGDGVVWVQGEQKMRRDSLLSITFVTFMTLVALIVGVGRIMDQPILIVEPWRSGRSSP